MLILCFTAGTCLADGPRDACGPAHPSGVGPPLKKSTPPTAAQIQQWVRDLDSDKYDVREAATRKLYAAGEAAVAPVTKVALDDNGEAGTRALLVLAVLVESKDTKTAQAAEAGLRKIVKSGKPRAVRLAAYALSGPDRLRMMRRLIGEIKFTESHDGKQRPVEVAKHGLYRFNDPARTHLDGTLWIWGKSGRPAAFLELYADEGEKNRWRFGWSSTSSRPLTVAMSGKAVWTPGPFEPRFLRLQKTDVPAGDAKTRSKQIEKLAARFSSHEFWLPERTRYELAVNAKPLHRYRDEGAGILDGAVIVIHHNVNPEVMLLLEAVHPEKGAAFWQAGMVRLSAAEDHVAFDGKPIWSCPKDLYFAGPPTRQFWSYYRDVPEVQKQAP
jgi:hypothetical protein